MKINTKNLPAIFAFAEIYSHKKSFTSTHTIIQLATELQSVAKRQCEELGLGRNAIYFNTGGTNQATSMGLDPGVWGSLFITALPAYFFDYMFSTPPLSAGLL